MSVVIVCGNPLTDELKIVGPFQNRKDAEIYMWYRFSSTKIYELEVPKTIDKNTPAPMDAF